MNDILESHWEAAISEYETQARKKGLYAQLYSECDGDETKIKARYLAVRAADFAREEGERADNLEKRTIDDCARVSREKDLAIAQKSGLTLLTSYTPNAEQKDAAAVEDNEFDKPIGTEASQLEKPDLTLTKLIAMPISTKIFSAKTLPAYLWPIGYLVASGGSLVALELFLLAACFAILGQVIISLTYLMGYELYDWAMRLVLSWPFFGLTILIGQRSESLRYFAREKFNFLNGVSTHIVAILIVAWLYQLEPVATLLKRTSESGSIELNLAILSAGAIGIIIFLIKKGLPR